MSRYAFEDLCHAARSTSRAISTAAYVEGPPVGLIVRLVGDRCGARVSSEETHWSLTPEEQRRASWDLRWVWGPPRPTSRIEHPARRIGAERFVYGMHWPLLLHEIARPTDRRPFASRCVDHRRGLDRLVRKTLT